MRKDMSKRGKELSSTSDPLQILKNRPEIEAGFQAKINSALRLDDDIFLAESTRNEWTLRLEVASKFLNSNPSNTNLQTLVEQAEIHLKLSIKKLKALHEEQMQSNRIREASYESLKQLQRLELLAASGQALQGHRNELTEIMTRTAQLELSAVDTNREALRSEYYMQAMLELSMERNQ